MLYKISDNAFLAYSRRLSAHIHQTTGLTQLLKLKPSIEFLRRQCITKTRTWSMLTVLQDYNFKITYLGECHAESARLS